MRILVTGGAGYIGSHTVLQLKKHGHFTVVYDNLSKGHKELIFSDVFIQGDIHNINLLKSVLMKYKIDVVMHFAAFIEAGESMIEPAKYFYNNTNGTIALLSAVIESNVKYFIFSSTAALFGYPQEIPITEECQLNPINAYGESKLLIERVLKWYSEIYDFNYISLRYFNASGADEQLQTGEWHNPETHLIPLAIQVAFGERKKLSIFGTDYETEDGTCVRDYIYINDLANAHILAINYLHNTNKSNLFNLGTENGYSVREIVNCTKEVTGVDFPVIESIRRPGDPAKLIASSQKIKKELGWKPQVTDLKKIIRTAVEWHKKMKKQGWS